MYITSSSIDKTNNQIEPENITLFLLYWSNIRDSCTSQTSPRVYIHWCILEAIYNSCSRRGRCKTKWVSEIFYVLFTFMTSDEWRKRFINRNILIKMTAISKIEKDRRHVIEFIAFDSVSLLNLYKIEKNHW